MPDPQRHSPPDRMMSWHIAVGVSIILVVAVRIAWAAIRRRVARTVIGWPDRIARGTQALLYLLLALVPALGWANASARNWSIRSGWIRLPGILPAGSRLGFTLGDIHSGTSIVMLGVLGIHIGAAFYHHFVLRDQTLRKMM